jgi:hypothetical protein
VGVSGLYMGGEGVTVGECVGVGGEERGRMVES